MQHAIVGSATFLRYWGELGQVHPNRVFVHFGDSDVVSLTNPRGYSPPSVFGQPAEGMARSHLSEGGFSALVRLGGAVAYSTRRDQRVSGRRAICPPQAFGGEPSPLAKFNALLAQANQLIAAELATGDYPVGYFLGTEHPHQRRLSWPATYLGREYHRRVAAGHVPAFGDSGEWVREHLRGAPAAA